MVKGVMASIGHHPVKLEELPGEVIPVSQQIMPFPNINLNLDSASGIGNLLHEINREVNPGMYGPPPDPFNPEKDEWGTPFEWAGMPDIYDIRDQNSMMNGRTLPSAMSMLCMRMKWGPYNDQRAFGESTGVPFEHLSIHLGKEKAVVFIVTAGEPVTLEDEIGIFPSDALITQLRVLCERNTPRT